MKVPLSWLKLFIDTEDHPQQIAKMLTLAGLEVDAVETLSPGFEGVVVATVISTEKHPDADKLCVAKVFDGSQELQVVCGASNCRPGIKTALATIGAILKDKDGSFKVKKSKLRGVESSGMLCSAKELGISDEDEGIIEFSPHLKDGADIAALYGDTIFEISLTPNLGHCNSVLGVARELAAITGAELLETQAQDPFETTPVLESIVKIESGKCPDYSCAIIKNVEIKESPDWLKNALLRSGVRPINNVVDVTQYVMLERGQPLHAFDLKKLKDQRIIVREAKNGEEITTLDGKTRNLNSQDLVIADGGSTPIAIAGVMGGGNSEVDLHTKDLLIESASFAPSSIRKTSKQLGLITDASKRFERGIDEAEIEGALKRACELICKVAGGTASGFLPAKKKVFPKQVRCRLSEVQRILGVKLSKSSIEEVFERLKWPVASDEDQAVIVKVPTYRNDVNSEIDLIEEIARIYGYDKIESKEVKFSVSTTPHSPLYLFEKSARARLVAEGLQEALTCDLIGPALLNIVQDDSMPKEAHIQVKNPTSIEQSILRTSLMPGLLQAAKYNRDHEVNALGIFEIGRIHFRSEKGYQEQSVAGILLMGDDRPPTWAEKPLESDFYTLKGVVENFLDSFCFSKVSFKKTNLNTFHPGRQAGIYLNGLEIGSLGEVHPSIVRRLDVPSRIYFAELNLQELLKKLPSSPKYQEVSSYPGSQRDWTVTLASSMPIDDVLNILRSIPSKLLEKCCLSAIYRSEKLGANQLNATFNFVYRDKTKTIAQEAVDLEHSRLVGKAIELIEKKSTTRV